MHLTQILNTDSLMHIQITWDAKCSKHTNIYLMHIYTHDAQVTTYTHAYKYVDTHTRDTERIWFPVTGGGLSIGILKYLPMEF